MDQSTFQRELAVVLEALHRQDVSKLLAVELLEVLSLLMTSAVQPDLVQELNRVMTTAIERLPRATYAQVANRYFMQCQPAWQVAKELAVSQETVWRYKNQAKADLAALLWFSLHPTTAAPDIHEVQRAEPFEVTLQREYRLTTREVELAVLLTRSGADTLSEGQIATLWITSLHNVKTHRRNLYRKIGFHRRAEVIQKLLHVKHSRT